MSDETTTAATDNQAGAQAENGTTGLQFSPEQQAYLDSLIGKARSEGRKSAQKELEEKQKQAQAEAEAQRLKDQQEWQKLAETHEARAKGLEPQITALSERVTAYETLVTEILDSRIKALGDAAKTAVAALPGEPDALAKLKWLTANEGLFKSNPLGPGNKTEPKQPTRPANGVVSAPPAQPVIKF